MPNLSLIPVDSRQKKTPWPLSIDGESTQLCSGDGQPVAFFRHEMANVRIILPSFWESIEHLGIVADTGNTVWFVPEKETVAKLRAFLYWTMAIHGDQPMRRLRKKAKSSFIWGFTCLILGLLVLLFGPLEGIIHHLALAVCVIGVLESARWLVKMRKIREVQQIQLTMTKDQL